MNGFFNVLKPTGVTSSDVVLQLKKILNSKKVGHLGTLDKAASGVLPVAVGDATKYFQHFLKKDKKYLSIFKFGIETTTLDEEGKVLQEKKVKINVEKLKKVISQFVGEIEQVPPIYSAVKIKGKRSAALAEKNSEVELKPRKIQIFDFVVLNQISENIFSFEIHCSAGTYVRSLARDVAKMLKTVAIASLIVRTQSGCFSIENAVSIEQIKKNPEKYLISIEKATSEENATNC